MVIGTSVICCCLVYSIMLLILYFSKRRINNTENKIYSVLVVINVFGLVLELLCCYFTYYNGIDTLHTMLCIICNRLFILYLLTWLSVFTFYIFYITFTKNDKIQKNMATNKKRFFITAGILYAIMLVFALMLPLYYFNDGNYVYSYGSATSLLMVFGGITIVFDIFCVFKNRKNIRNRQYYPLFVLIILMIIVLIIRNVNPGIILINSTFAFITALMFHTIENPDVQLIGELYKNKKLIEKSNEDTSKFLFKMTQDIKNPVKELISISRDMTNETNIDVLKQASKHINNYSTQIDYLINKALNISSMDTQKIKIYENKYNVINLFKEISFRTQEKINPEVQFSFSINQNIPEYLYGDAIKLKQAVYSLIDNAMNNTKTGFINLDVSSIVRYNVCRLIISIEDSGQGLDIDEVNKILSLNSEDLEEIKLTSLEDRNNLDFKSVKKIINILGGSMMLKSELQHGTTVTLVLDQKIVANDDTTITQKLESYEQTLYGDKKVLIVDDDAEELANITSLLEKENVIVSSSVYGRDCIEKVRVKMKYNLIILDDDMPNYSALAILQELQKIKNFKTPVVVMINDNKESIKLHYLKDGFADCIMKSKLESELARVIKRF